MNSAIVKRSQDELEKAIDIAQYTVYKKYLMELGDYPLLPPPQSLLDETAKKCVRFLQLEEFSCKKGEDIHQKLSTVYHASMSLGCTLVILIDVAGADEPANIYIGVRNSGEDSNAIKRLTDSYETLENGLKSNFPGTKIPKVDQSELDDLLGVVFRYARHISSVSCVASARDKSKTEHKDFIQGLERFIDTMRGNSYTAIFIAEPISYQELAEIRTGYESIYSALSSFRKSTWSYSQTESNAIMENLSEGISSTITQGTSHTQGYTKGIGAHIGVNGSQGSGSSYSTASSRAESSPTKISRVGQVLSSPAFSKAIGIAAGSIAAAATAGNSAAAAGAYTAAQRVAAGIGGIAGSAMTGSSVSQTVTSSIANSVSRSLGLNGGLSGHYDKSTSDTGYNSYSDTKSTTKTRGSTSTVGSGKTLQIENINKSVDEMLKRIDEQLKRSCECEDYGAYSCGAYFLSGSAGTSRLAANTYRALMIGNGSSVECGAINVWNGVKDESNTVSNMKEYLRRFVHPTFFVPLTQSPRTEQEIITYSPGTIVSGMELPLHLGIPTKSVYGLPVIEHAEFGRNVKCVKNENGKTDFIKIGKIFHMGEEESSSVALDINNLTKHTFITGSTGSGKSNTIYTMLDKLSDNGIRFMVVEPAKGEYKDTIGKRNDVVSYVTNPCLVTKMQDVRMLRINPFRFPKHTHVLEHLDRLVEIFNVCWPMYAAMPAILKDAIERAYEASGWDLITSENRYDENLFPSFNDVVKEIRKVLDESEYSADNKGDYTGSLVTRLHSLTNGINRLIFTNDDISDETLFDSNVIIDLSRVGSTETKSLIMGLLVLKLQEHRMEQRATGANANDDLKHITVLEEAHNLLRRTSVEQVTEGANLKGKSVEMLANSIAEMRTYGEGFVIADQSPGLLDMSVIRNTNTKLILRLPDFSDRELVGRAAGLSDNQITELAKLEQGVAAVSQSDWLEPVLCKVDKYSGSNDKYRGKKRLTDEKRIADSDTVAKSILDCIMTKEIYRKGDRVDIAKLKESVMKSGLDTSVKCELIDYIQSEKETAFDSLRKLIYDFLKAEKAVKASVQCDDITNWIHCVADNLSMTISGYSKRQIDLVMALIIYEQSLRDSSYNDILNRYAEMLGTDGGVY